MARSHSACCATVRLRRVSASSIAARAVVSSSSIRETQALNKSNKNEEGAHLLMAVISSVDAVLGRQRAAVARGFPFVFLPVPAGIIAYK